MTRRFDLHIQTLPEAEQRATFKFTSLGFNGGIGVKGFQYLINTWLRVFLTARGSDPTDLEFGTAFPSLIGSNSSLSDARDAVLLAIDQCNEIVTDLQQRDLTLTPSERLATASMVEFTYDPTAPGFDVRVEIKNRANERLILSVPDFSTV